MKSLRTLAFTLAAWMLLAANGDAIEVKNKIAVSPFVGVGIPIGDAAETDSDDETARGAKPGLGFGGAVEYGMTENLVVGGKFGYNRFGFDDELLGGELPDGAEVDANWTILEFGAYIKLLMSAGSATRPYFRAGVNAGKADLEGDITLGDMTAEGKVDIANSLGLEGGVGVMHMFSDQIGGFAEGTFNHLMTDGKDMESGIDDDVETSETEGNFQWIAVRAGLIIFLGK